MHSGQRIGKYVLGDKIAVGGMAEVWAARAEGPEGFVKPVALKFILESFSGDPELEKLFFKEARIAAQLQHANIVAVFDFDKMPADPERGQSGRYYIAMEHVEGHDARRVVEAAKLAGYVFPLPLALYLAGEVMKGLRYVHERRENGRRLGLVHRDVSPHNVLVGFSGEVKLSDFGIAKSLAHSTRTKTGTIRGKLSYASPEQLNGESVDHRTDQFAMGITLWEILAGRPLFDGNDEIEIAGKVMRCDIPPLGLVCPERKVPLQVEALVRRMLSPQRDQRFPTTADALSGLLALPGYSGDGVGLGDLVRTLFHRAGHGPDSTMNVPVLRPPGGAGKEGRHTEPATPRSMRGEASHGELDAGAGAGAPVGAPKPSEVETRTMARGQSPAAAGRRSPVATRRAVTTVRVRPERRRSWPIVAAAVAVGAIAVVAAVVASGRLTAPPPNVAAAPEPEPAGTPAVAVEPVRAPAAAEPAGAREVAPAAASAPVAAPAGAVPPSAAPPTVTAEDEPVRVPVLAIRPALINPPAAAPAPSGGSPPPPPLPKAAPLEPAPAPSENRASDPAATTLAPPPAPRAAPRSANSAPIVE